MAWLLEWGGSSLSEVDRNGTTALDMMERKLGFKLSLKMNTEADGEVIALLRVMVVRGAPPVQMAARLLHAYARVVHDGARLLLRLPAYLARRRTLLDEHCPLIAPLLALVSGYEQPIATDELWATGLGSKQA
jgi:hypothetical protein